MAKAEKERSDGLEISSIGKMYTGDWDKKYWSSSRGKDRYPFPVGYKTVRAHNGVTYQMEIHEGSKGPSFLITSSDGHSCSGQTPDMAWEIFQKKGCPRIKLWLGKRFSCKIDGVEFFGFKNPFVQRLLRELVSRDGTTQEHSGVASGSTNDDSGKKNQSSCAESFTEVTDPAPLAKLNISQVKGKRSQKIRSIDPSSINAASFKKIRPDDKIPNDNGNIDSGHEKCNNFKHGPSLTNSPSNEEHKIHNEAKDSLVLVNLETVIEEKINHFPVKDDLDVMSCDPSDHHPKREEPPHKEDKLVNTMATGATGILSISENPLARATNEFFPEEPKDGEVSITKDTEAIKDIDLCVPDSLEFLHDRTFDSQSNCQKEKESPSKGNGDLVAEIGKTAISETIASDSHQEEKTAISHDRTSDSQSNSQNERKNHFKETCQLIAEIGKTANSETDGSESHQGEETSKLNENSEKSDFDSAADDITKSMMSFLLPQALPLLSSKKKSPTLLKTFSRKKRRFLKIPEKPIGREEIQKENKGTDNHIIVSPEGGHTKVPPLDMEETNIVPDSLDVFSSGHEATVVPDSFIDNDEDCSIVPKVDLATINDNKNKPKKLLDTLENSSMCDAGKNNLSSTENNLCKSKVDMCENPDDGLCHKTHSKEKELKTSLEHKEGATGENSAGTVNYLEDLHKEHSDKTSKVTGSSSLTGNLNLDTLTRQNKGPLSESIICRSSTDVFALQTYVASKPKPPSDSVVVGKLDPVSDIFDEKNISTEKLAINSIKFGGSVAEGSCLMPRMKKGHSDEPENLHFLGRYIHPLPISLVLVTTNEEDICICVLCGASVDQGRTLFMYKLSIKEQMLGSPSYISHTTLLLPLATDAFRREISMDRTCLQLTPDGHSLVLLNSVKAPCCREGDLQCLCSACTSSFCNENTGIKIVHIKCGYISVIMKLKTTETLQCMLVCEPNYLIGVEESGILHLWVMNSTWSALIEECDLSTSDCIFPCIVELKRIPNQAGLVLGHNGFGEFGLWDIRKRIFVARFSSPSTSVFQFLPISVFKWQRKYSIFAKPQSSENMASTKRSLSKQDGNESFNPEQGDAAIWILISTISNSDINHEFLFSDHKMNTVGLWRLALVVENSLILGDMLDLSATAIGASTEDGIIGTSDGAVYMWDLCTGTKLCDLHHFQGASVSCIATDDSRLGPIAIAGGDQLLVYVRSRKGLSNATSNEQELE